MRHRFAAALFFSTLATYPAQGYAGTPQARPRATPARDVLQVPKAEIDFHLDATTTLRAVGSIRVAEAADGKPAEAFFVRVDRETMSRAGLSERYAALLEAFPNACDDEQCDLRFSYDSRSDAYVLAGEPGTFEGVSGSPEWKYVAIRRMS